MFTDIPEKQPADSMTEEDLQIYRQVKCHYDVYRKYIRVEHSLQNERSTWHNVIQGFLFATLGVLGQWSPGQTGFPGALATERHVLPLILAGAGFYIAVISRESIQAADRAIRRLCNDWEKITENEPYHAVYLKYLPGIAGAGVSDIEECGKKAALRIPAVIMFAWACVAAMFLNDEFFKIGFHPQSSAAVHPCQIQLPPDQTLSQADMIAEIACAEYTVRTLQKELNSPVVTVQELSASQPSAATKFAPSDRKTHRLPSGPKTNLLQDTGHSPLSPRP